MLTLCFCDLKLPFESCCKPYLDGRKIADTPVTLMRSRYSAYVTHNIDYLLATWHPDCGADKWRTSIVESFQHTQWNGLKIIATADGQNNHEGYVEFIATFRDSSSQQEKSLHERSRFVKENQRWYYIDGLTPRTGRNDPCPCGSGKKHKKCCAK